MMLRKSPYRTLIAVYFLAVLAGVCEIAGRSSNVPDVYGDPVYNFPDAMWRLYPGRSDSEYMIGKRYEAVASRSIERGGRLSQSRDGVDTDAEFREAVRHYQHAIDLGLRSDEGLAYNYALSLIRTHADPALIDRAVADWRREFPHSSRRDLNERRRAIELQFPLQQRPSVSNLGTGSP